LHHRQILILPVHQPPGVGSSGLQAGAAVEDNHHVLAEISGLRFLSLSQAFARRHHQYDRHDAPRNAEHSQKCAQLVRPKGAKHIAEKIGESHSSSCLDETGSGK